MESNSNLRTSAGVKTSGKATILVGLGLFVLLFVSGGAWAYYATLAGAVVAQGQVAVLGKPKTIQHLDGGIVAQIDVEEGDLVKKHDVLIKLDDTLLQANLKIYQNRLIESLAQRARLVAERDDNDLIVWDDSLLRLFAIQESRSVKDGQQKLFDARQATTQGQVSQQRERIAQFRNQMEGIRSLKRSKQTQIDLLETELSGIQILREKQLVSKSQLLNIERQRQELIGQNAEHDSELARIQNSIGEAEIQILQITREFRQSVLTELRQSEREVNEMTQQLHATVEQLRRIDIRAPVSGVVHELGVYTIGGVVGPGAPVLQIIPNNNNHAFEANIEPQFIDELSIDQPATIRFPAFNQNTTPELIGSVKFISANVVIDEQTGEPYYKVRLDVPGAQLSKLNGQTLIPGMPIEVFMKTRERSAFNYLTKPLLDQINRAFREE